MEYPGVMLNLLSLRRKKSQSLAVKVLAVESLMEPDAQPVDGDTNFFFSLKLSVVHNQLLGFAGAEMEVCVLITKGIRTLTFVLLVVSSG